MLGSMPSLGQKVLRRYFRGSRELQGLVDPSFGAVVGLTSIGFWGWRRQLSQYVSDCPHIISLKKRLTTSGIETDEVLHIVRFPERRILTGSVITYANLRGLHQ